MRSIPFPACRIRIPCVRHGPRSGRISSSRPRGSSSPTPGCSRIGSGATRAAWIRIVSNSSTLSVGPPRCAGLARRFSVPIRSGGRELPEPVSEWSWDPGEPIRVVMARAPRSAQGREERLERFQPSVLEANGSDRRRGDGAPGGSLRARPRVGGTRQEAAGGRGVDAGGAGSPRAAGGARRHGGDRPRPGGRSPGESRDGRSAPSRSSAWIRLVTPPSWFACSIGFAPQGDPRREARRRRSHLCRASRLRGTRAAGAGFGSCGRGSRRAPGTGLGPVDAASRPPAPGRHFVDGGSAHRGGDLPPGGAPRGGEVPLLPFPGRPRHAARPRHRDRHRLYARGAGEGRAGHLAGRRAGTDRPGPAFPLGGLPRECSRGGRASDSQ